MMNIITNLCTTCFMIKTLIALLLFIVFAILGMIYQSYIFAFIAMLFMSYLMYKALLDELF